MEMEALLAKLQLTGISSAHEVIGYGSSDRRGGARAADARVVARPEVDPPSDTDGDDDFGPDLWEGECG